MEWVKYISPLLGVVLGAFITHWVDKKKAEKESSKAFKAFLLEMGDFEAIAKRDLINLDKLFEKVCKLDASIVTDHGTLYPIHLPGKISLISYDWVVNLAFSKTSSEIRMLLRALPPIVQRLNDQISKLHSAKEIEDFNHSEIADLAEQLSIFYYLASRISHEKERFKYFTETDEEVKNKVFTSLNLCFHSFDILKRV